MPLPMQHDHSEETLVQRVRHGDSAALGALFDRHGESVYRLAYRLLGTREDAEDAVQDVFGGLQNALTHYQESGTFGSWLSRVTARTALMRLRADRRRAQRTGAEVEEVSRNDDVALRMTLDTAFGALPDTLRAVVTLRMVEGYSHEEIASALQISVSASKVRLHRAVHRLQHTLRGSL
ncbi:MAG: sigma-70 family RNA polymerase sigma factor [Gemmatimonadota bacterium]